MKHKSKTYKYHSEYQIKYQESSKENTSKVKYHFSLIKNFF